MSKRVVSIIWDFHNWLQTADVESRLPSQSPCEVHLSSQTIALETMRNGVDTAHKQLSCPHQSTKGKGRRRNSTEDQDFQYGPEAG